MHVLGVTGNIGSGKSTVCLLLSQLGCPIVDADLVAHRVYRRGSRTWRQIWGSTARIQASRAP